MRDNERQPLGTYGLLPDTDSGADDATKSVVNSIDSNSNDRSMATLVLVVHRHILTSISSLCRKTHSSDLG